MVPVTALSDLELEMFVLRLADRTDSYRAKHLLRKYTHGDR